ncbi:ALP1-like protein isoform X1 [Tanacetum coccineum]
MFSVLKHIVILLISSHNSLWIYTTTGAALPNHHNQIYTPSVSQSPTTAVLAKQELKGVHSAREFVWWYKGHPNFSKFTPNLKSTDTAIVLGQLFLVMWLLMLHGFFLRLPKELTTTDIATHALDALRESSIRRGPVQAACTAKELREIIAIKDLYINIKEADLLKTSADDVKLFPYLSFGYSETAMRVFEFLSKASSSVVSASLSSKLGDNDSFTSLSSGRPVKFVKSELTKVVLFYGVNLDDNTKGEALLGKSDADANGAAKNGMVLPFTSLAMQEVGGSSSDPKRRRTYIPRERETAEQRLLEDYFGNDEFEPKYLEEKFRRMYRMSSILFNKIVNNILSCDVEPIPEYFTYFKPRHDATGPLSIGPILKCTSAIRQLAYDTAPDAFDEYLQIAERTSRECLDNFTKCIHVLYVEKFLRKPTAADIEKTYQLHEQKHGLPGMLRKANNDLNVLYGSLLFDKKLADTAPECPFVVNGHTYRKYYYLADGIYPAWSTFVKTFPVARDEKSLKFKRVEEAARKDIERAFGVLQSRWGIIRQPARPYQINTLKRIMYCCIMLHNMILDDEGFEVNMRDLFVNPAPNIQRDWVERCDLHIRKSKELRDRKTHIDLRQDLVEHLSNND